MLLKHGNPVKGDGELDGFTRLDEGSQDHIKAVLDHTYTHNEEHGVRQDSNSPR